MDKKPLVSIIISNCNYGRYLVQCLGSAVNQTYENLEIIFGDNASSDDSWEIARQFANKYPDRLRIYRNETNIGVLKNSMRLTNMAKGVYMQSLNSDDAIKPDFIKRCMDIILSYENAEFVITARDNMDENGVISKEAPFYNQSCVIPGYKQAEVFMMSGIGVPSQGLYNRSLVSKVFEQPYKFQIAQDWFLNFCFSTMSDMGYICEPLTLYRTHTQNETSRSIQNFAGIFEHYLLLQAFDEIAERSGLDEVRKRMPVAQEKLGNMCLRYCVQLLKCEKTDIARRYLYLAPMLKPAIINDDDYKFLWSCCEMDMHDAKRSVEKEVKTSLLQRVVSYDPPEGFIPYHTV